MAKTCFVVMAIGNQEYGNLKVNSDELQAKYNDLIKEAILIAEPSLEIKRADEISVSGSINDDIVNHLIYSDIVIVDITYPNPNVFYELGLRHAFKPGTLLIKEKNGFTTPFDISNLRYVEYENSVTGLKELARKLKLFITGLYRDPSRPDNTFLSIARFQKVKSFDYSENSDTNPETQILFEIFQSPEIMELFTRQSQGEIVQSHEIANMLARNPKVVLPIIDMLVKSGKLSLQSIHEADE